MGRNKIDPAKRKELAQQTGRRLRLARESIGINIPDLAKRSSVDKSVISRIENGKITPSLQTLQKLAFGLEMNLGVFLANSPFDSSKAAPRIHEEGFRLLTCSDCLRKRYTAESEPVCTRCGCSVFLDEFPEPYLMPFPFTKESEERAKIASRLMYFIVSTDDLAPQIKRGDLLVVDPAVWIEREGDLVVATSKQTGEVEVYRAVSYDTGVQGANLTALKHLRPKSVYSPDVQRLFERPFWNDEDQPDPIGRVIELRRTPDISGNLWK